MDGVLSQRKKINILFLLGICLPIFTVGMGLGWILEKIPFSSKVHFRKGREWLVVPLKSVRDGSTQLIPEVVPPLLSWDPQVRETPVCIEVLSTDQKPVPELEVIAEVVPVSLNANTTSTAQFEKKGELGILYGALPFPNEVITGKISSDGASQSSGERFRKLTDDRGVAMFLGLPEGIIRFTANRGELFAKAVIKKEAGTRESDTGTCQGQEGVRVVLYLEPSPTGWIPGPPNLGSFEEGMSAEAGPKSRLEGLVLDSRRRTIAGPIRLQWGRKGTEHSLVVEGNGHFAIPAVPIGEIRLQVEAEGYVPLVKTVQVEGVNSLSDLRIELEQAGRLRGRLLLPNASSATGIKISVQNDQGETIESALTDTRGEFFIKNLPPGGLWVEGGGATAQIQVYPNHEQWVLLESSNSRSIQNP